MAPVSAYKRQCDAVLLYCVLNKHGHCQTGCICTYVLIWCHIDPVLTPLSLACFQIFEAYGQTECTAACSFTIPGDWQTGGFLYLKIMFFSV